MEKGGRQSVQGHFWWNVRGALRGSEFAAMPQQQNNRCRLAAVRVVRHGHRRGRSWLLSIAREFHCSRSRNAAFPRASTFSARRRQRDGGDSFDATTGPSLCCPISMKIAFDVCSLADCSMQRECVPPFCEFNGPAPPLLRHKPLTDGHLGRGRAKTRKELPETFARRL